MSDRPKRNAGRPMTNRSTTRKAAHIKAAEAAGTDADAYLHHLLDRLHRTPVKFEPMGGKMALAELKAFADTVFTYPRMPGYFDPQHLTDLRRFPELAEIAAKPLSIGGTVEIVSLPVTHDRTQGFHIYRVYEDGTSDHHGVIVGYLIHSMNWAAAGGMARRRCDWRTTSSRRTAITPTSPCRSRPTRSTTSRGRRSSSGGRSASTSMRGRRFGRQ